MINSLTLDSLALVGPTVTDYLVNVPLEGLEAPDMRVHNFDRPGEDGQIVSSALYSGRLLTISGTVKNIGCDQYEAARAALITACAIRRDSNRYPVLKRIEFTTDAGLSYFCNGQVNRVKLPVSTIADFQINIVVPDPMIFGAAVSSGAITRAAGGGVIYPVIYPAIYSATTGGSATVSNAGSADAWPIITLKGSLSNPALYHAQTNTLFILNYVLSSTDTVVIDMQNKTVVLNDAVSLRNAVDRSAGSDWFALVPGSNVITFSTGSTSDEGTLKVDFFNAYIGV